MDRKIIVPIIILVFLTGIAESYAYPFRAVFHDDNSVNNMVNLTSFYHTGNCAVNTFLYATASNSGLPYELGNAWYSPDNTILTTTNPPYTQSQTCGFQGNYTAATSSRNFYEGKTTTTTTASTTNTWGISYYNCDPLTNTGTLSDLIIYSNTTEYDNHGNHPYGYMETVWDYTGLYQAEPALATLKSTFLSAMTEYETLCTGTTLVHDIPFTKTGFSANFGGRAFWLAVPFNGQYAGKVNVTITGQSLAYIGMYWSCTRGQYILLYDRTTQQWQTLGSGVPFSTNLNLPVGQAREYYLVIGSVCTTGGGATTNVVYTNTDYNINISAYVPDISCGDYGSCVGGSRARYCTDLNGKLSPWYEYDTAGCQAFLPEQSVYLGFDTGVGKSYINYTWQCAFQAILFTCYDTYVGAPDSPSRARNLPEGWIVNNVWACDNLTHSPEVCGLLDDVADIQSIPDAPEGGSALKLWNIPPTTNVPVFNITGSDKIVYPCAGTTYSTAGLVRRDDLNNTFYIARNITAYSPYMSLNFYYKACNQPEQGKGICPSGFFFVPQCYTSSGDCNVTPTGQFYVKFTDTNTGTDVYKETISTASNTFLVKNSQLSGLVFNNTYQLSFSVPSDSPNPQDPVSYCIYLDDVQVQFRSSPLNCTSRCDPSQDYNQDGIKDYSYITASPSGSSCDFSVSYFDPNCVPSSLVSDAQAMKAGTKNQTCDGLTLISVSNGVYSYAQNSSVCIAQKAQLSSTSPQSGEQIIAGFANFFTIPAVVGLFMAILISALISGKINQYTQGSMGQHGTGAIFLVSFVGILTALTIAGFFPTWLYIVLIVIAGGIAAKVLGFIGGG
jgi:hypothetical protein